MLLVAIIIVFGNGLADSTAETLTFIAAIPSMFMAILLPWKVCRQVAPELFIEADEEEDSQF